MADTTFIDGTTPIVADWLNDVNAVTYSTRPNKNYILNGNFDIWQRGTPIAITAGSTIYSADQWAAWSGLSGTCTITRLDFAHEQTDVPNNPRYYMRYSMDGAATTVPILEQRIENVRTLAGEEVTLSFWVKTPSTSITIANVLARQYYGSAGSATDDTVIASDVVVEGNVWQKLTYTFTIPAIDAGETISGGDDFLAIRLYLPSGTAASLDLAQVQLEKGACATGFEYRTVGEELALCKRYYEIFTLSQYNCIANGFGFSSTVARVPISYVHKRATPTVNSSNLELWNNATSATVTGLSFIAADASTGHLEVTVSAGLTIRDPYMLRTSNVSGGWLSLSAEL